MTEMTDRTIGLKSALRANQALILEAQAEITRYHTKEIEAAELIDRIIRLFDGLAQREAQRLANEALVERLRDGERP
jgi:hypothetical protein